MWNYQTFVAVFDALIAKSQMIIQVQHT